MKSARENFSLHLAQTSDTPIGLEIDRAEGCWLVARDGRRYLDLIAGIGVSALGHGHPNVLDAIDRQAKRHLHVMVYGEYVIEAQANYAARLSEVLGRGFERVFFTNSGAEAIEGALKLARKATRRVAFAAFDGAYHGDTMGALALAGNQAFRAPFGDLIGPIIHLPFDDINVLSSIDEKVAAVVIELVQAEGGVRIPRREFMAALRRRCDETGALLIFDEVLTGFARTGRLFAMDHFGVCPDIVILAKALGGGLPLGAFAARESLMTVLAHAPPLGHITTFGGHPLSCAAGLACLDVITSNRLWERAQASGELLTSRIRALESNLVREVRGLGLLIGIDFYDASRMHRFVRAALEMGVVLNWTLNAERVVRIAPPLTIADDEIDFAVAVIAQSLERAGS